jgi:hypothetical protein
VSAALSSLAFLALLVVGAAAVVGLLHRALRPKEINARSATALRELEPRGGRHRFHVRLFEVIALAAACTAAVGVLLLFAAAPDARPEMPVVGGGALLAAIWWAWRRGALRAVEAEPPLPGSVAEGDVDG